MLAKIRTDIQFVMPSMLAMYLMLDKHLCNVIKKKKILTRFVAS